MGTFTLGVIGGAIFGGKGATRTGIGTGRIGGGTLTSSEGIGASKILGLFVMSSFGIGSEKKKKKKITSKNTVFCLLYITEQLQLLNSRTLDGFI